MDGALASRASVPSSIAGESPRKSVGVIALDRRFYEWKNEEPPDPRMHRALGLGDVGIGWDDLLSKWRAVVLAEAGSGKSTEMEERARLIRADGRAAFYAAVEDVGRDGLDAAVGPGAGLDLAVWRTSADDAWFFVDSVDEAKSSGVRLGKVLRKLADGLQGCEGRAHIILSGRITDWEFRTDLRAMEKWLPTPAPSSGPIATPDEELRRIVRQQRLPDQKPQDVEKPFVAIMAPLDEGRVRLFAEGKGVPDVNAFLEQVGRDDLWHFAERPLDLDWLVRFWRSERRFGSLAEMVERSITERLKEKPSRAYGDVLDGAAARRAVERIGAGMVFGRRSTIAIPDGDVAFGSDSPMDLADVFPDWSPEDRALLLLRPIFDPATLGRARFHNDNQGLVRSYLTARWLEGLREENLSTGALFDLLFAEPYGLEVVKPSVAETAAWLALWDRDVCNELVRRDPGLLIAGGDPGSLSPEVRGDVLTALLEQIAGQEFERPWWNYGWMDNEQIRRFAHPDLGGRVRELWSRHSSNAVCAQLLLRIVWLGRLKDCGHLAQEVAYTEGADSVLRAMAGRALLATGDEEAKRQYAAFILEKRANLPVRMVRDAMMDLFPAFIRVRDLLAILASIDLINDRSGVGFEWEGPQLVEKVTSREDLEELVSGLHTEVGREVDPRVPHYESQLETAYFPAMAAGALMLLRGLPPDKISGTAVDALLRIGEPRGSSRELRERLGAVWAELRRSAARRSAAFWGTAEHLQREGALVINPRQLVIRGYGAGLESADLDWLLEEGLTRSEADRRLAINSAFVIFLEAGRPAEMLERIRMAASSDPVASEVYESWVRPQPQAEPSEIEFETQRIMAENAARNAERDQSWINFIEELKSDPARIDKLRTSRPPNLTGELYQLWRLLSGAANRSRYAIESVAPLERIAGSAVAEAVRAGLSDHWRNWPPPLRRGKSAGERVVRYAAELMGIAGISLEAAGSERWAERLSSAEAASAAGYAILEINRLPGWLADLARARPSEVRGVLMEELRDEFSRPDLSYYETLGHVAYGDDEIVKLVAGSLLDELTEGVRPPGRVLGDALRIVVGGLQKERQPRFVDFGIERFEREADGEVAVQYLAAAFVFDAKKAVDALVARLSSLGDDQQAQLMDRFLSKTFGDSAVGGVFRPGTVPPELLELLVRWTLKTNGPSAARGRPEGVVHPVDESDWADNARSAVFHRFLGIPGPATFQGLMRLKDDPTCSVPRARLQELAEERAMRDSESAPWLPGDALEFEKTHQTAPRAALDLQRLVVHRIEDVQHELLHADFAQGKTLKGLPHEADVQRWVADRLRLKQGRSYSVEREPHVVDEKEPDVRVRAKATDESVAIEIKVAESWTLKELDEALEAQLCGRYLTSRDGRYGILLLVHQRPKQWKGTEIGASLSFSDVVARLRAKAARIAGSQYGSPRAEVCVLDVSMVPGV